MQQFTTALSADTIGRLVSGYADRPTAQYCGPTTSVEEMADRLQVTFRPLPKGFRHAGVIRLREAIRRELLACGVAVVPWEDATSEFHQTTVLPVINRRVHYRTRAVRRGINAVIDVEKPESLRKRLGIQLVESVYRIHNLFRRKGSSRSVTAIARLSLWAEDHAVWHLQDFVNTQAITLTEFDPRLVDSEVPYEERIPLGLAALAQAFSPVLVGLCGDKLSVLNLNLSDSVYRCSEIDRLVLNCLIPKLYLPITPLLAGQFDIETYDPRAHDSVGRVVELGRGLGPTGLLPNGHYIQSLLRRKSRRDIVKLFLDGRTGVSFGFLAHVEPPQYVGPREIPAGEFERLSTVDGFDSDELRRNGSRRLYARVAGAAGTVYRQVPDLWIASSRSGANKTDLDPATDVLRIGYRHGLRMQLPHAGETRGKDVKPSYDLRVMLALALSAALHRPEFLQRGASLFHFHGYPHRDWFLPGEGCVGMDNPAVPCGTLEAGLLNFQGLAELFATGGGDLPLAAVIEPDHGSNLMAPDPAYLLERVRQGVADGQLALGSRHFASLRQW